MPTIVRGQVSVSLGNTHVTSVSSGTGTLAPLLPLGGTTAGGTGSYLESVIVMLQTFTTVGSCSVYIADNTQGTTQIFGTLVAGTTTAINSGTIVIRIGAHSKFGPWRVGNQNGVLVTAIGKWL